jgi:hypothetical protein
MASTSVQTHIQELGRSDDGAIRKSKKPRLARTTTSVREAITQVIKKSLDL